jgi:hypothetical protein
MARLNTTSCLLRKRSRDVAYLRFTLGAYDHTRTLVIDPVIAYATYMTVSAGSIPAGLQADRSIGQPSQSP